MTLRDKAAARATTDPDVGADGRGTGGAQA